MSTPIKALQKYSEELPSMLDDSKAITEGLISLKNDLPDLWRNGIEDFEKLIDVILEKSNRHTESIRRHIGYINQAGGTYQQCLELGEEKKKGKIDPKDYTINTSLLNEAPRLTPKVGYEEAMKRLNLLTPKHDDHAKITIRQLNGCLGFRASEAHCVEFWIMAVPEDSTQAPIKTNGMINPLPDGTIFFFQAVEFIKTLYRTYYLPLIRGEIKAISNHKGKFVRFLKA